MATSGDRNDPYASFNFLVEIEGVTKAGFSECSVTANETTIIEYRTGAEEFHPRKLPGQTKYPNITLKRGFTNGKELWEWRKKVLQGKVDRQAGSIILLDESRKEALRWDFQYGWPSKWEGPAMNAKNNDVAIESMEIAVEFIELK